MELVLTRRYYEEGTNGELQCEGETICHTIELPWKNNKPRRSCIPEGLYELKKRYSLHHKEHLVIIDVPGREDILIHPANNARLELQGCIAPVTKITGEGQGSQSLLATNLLYREVTLRIDRERVWLRITSLAGEPEIARKRSPVIKLFPGVALQAA